MKWPLYAAFAVIAACGGQSTFSSGPDASSADSGGFLCVPNQSVACVGPGGCAGGQACNAEGNGYLPCDCGGSPGSEAGADSGQETGSSSADAGEEAGSSGSDSGLDSGADAGSSGGSDSGSESGGDSGHEAGSSDASASGFDGGSDTGVGDSGTDSVDQDGASLSSRRRRSTWTRRVRT